ncbi:cytochrome c [Aliikangiella sp. G2MR2-5]|uniref:c-type cytochrome n=1 Tax=Aliikangiella sp. G2MR2-5 TaxID=2788943 RepID=UPI0018A983EB|nr:cytochrome c [Aliikangiella sp. G2MR2-5]
MIFHKNSSLKTLPVLAALIYLVLTGAIGLFWQTVNAEGLADSESSSNKESIENPSLKEVPHLSSLSKKDREELIYLLKQDCGSCHGLTLQGGLGPPLLKANLKGKPESYIAIVIAEGRPGTPMPPWKSILDEQQINFLAHYLKSDFNVLSRYQVATNNSEKNN